jgi:peptidoglycan/LPS O-acetylase OafA/YrhL
MTTIGKSGFLPRLESLRGVAAVSVVAYHVFAQFSDTNVAGMAPVVMFFVLSGFVLARSLANNDDPVRFFRHRLFRLFPAAISTVLLLTFLHFKFGFFVGFPGRFDPINVVLNAVMIRNDINSVMWSMTVECFATPLVFFAFLTCGRWGAVPLWTAVLVLFGLSFVGPYVHLLGGFSNLAPLYAFVVGVLVHFRGRDLVEKLGPGTCWLLALAALALFGWCGSRKQVAPLIALECLSSALVIALIAFRDSVGLFRILDVPVVHFYGRISYSFYLLHLIGIGAATRIFDAASHQAGGTAAVLAAVAATTPIAWLSWRLVERPFIALGRRFETIPSRPLQTLGDRERALP